MSLNDAKSALMTIGAEVDTLNIAVDTLITTQESVQLAQRQLASLQTQVDALHAIIESDIGEMIRSNPEYKMITLLMKD